jgi:CII-binding regulator of phage lambda lysogenization HflD
MNDQELTKLLEQLHSEIEKTAAVDEKGQELLNNLEMDIQKLLNRSQKEQAPPISSINRMQDTINYFEASHPTLTTTLAEIMTILGNAGI